VLPALTTASANVVVIVMIELNVPSATTTGVSDTAGLVWTKRATSNQNQTGNITYMEEWWAPSTGALSGDVITFTTTTSTTYAIANAFCISGAANIAAPFDVDGSLPVQVSYSNASPGSASSASTTAARTTCFAGYRFNGTGSPTAGAGFTTLQAPAGFFLLTEYIEETSPQTGLVFAIGTGANDVNGTVCDAIVMASLQSQIPMGRAGG